MPFSFWISLGLVVLGLAILAFVALRLLGKLRSMSWAGERLETRAVRANRLAAELHKLQGAAEQVKLHRSAAAPR